MRPKSYAANSVVLLLRHSLVPWFLLSWLTVLYMCPNSWFLSWEEKEIHILSFYGLFSLCFCESCLSWKCSLVIILLTQYITIYVPSRRLFFFFFLNSWETFQAPSASWFLMFVFTLSSGDNCKPFIFHRKLLYLFNFSNSSSQISILKYLVGRSAKEWD